MLRMFSACLLLLLVPAVAWSEETIVVDQWVASFDRGTKTGWEHHQLVEHKGAEAGKAHFVLTVRIWTLMGEGLPLSVSRSSVSTDATGRVLSSLRTLEGPMGPARASFDGTQWTYKVRANEAVSGSTEDALYSPAVVRLLTMRGKRKAGEISLKVLDIPGDGVEEITVHVEQGEADTWRYRRDDYEATYAPGGDLIEARRPTREPHAIEKPATAANAADRNVRDGATAVHARVKHMDLNMVRLQALPHPWSLQHQDMGAIPNIALVHPFEVGLFVTELPAPFGATEKAAMALATLLRQRMMESADGMKLGEPVYTPFRETPAVRMNIAGSPGGAPAAGEFWLVRSRRGTALMLMAAYQADLAKSCKPLLEQAYAALDLEGAPPPEVTWTRAHATHSGLSFELPEDFRRRGASEFWQAPNGNMAVVMRVAAPEGTDAASVQTGWLTVLAQNASVQKIDVESTSEVPMDGKTMRQVVALVTISTGEGVPPVYQRCISRAIKQADGHVVTLLVATAPQADTKAPAWMKRTLDSARWDKAGSDAKEKDGAGK